MKSRPTIFISGVSHEFGSFRDAVENEIEMKGCFAENQPGFPPDYRTVEQMLRPRLRDSDAVIHIVGFRYGAEPNQRPADAPRRSYTQMEFDIARELQKPVYVFLSNEAAVRQPPTPDEQPEDAEATALQLAHREAVKETNHLYYFFKDQAEVCKLVAEIPPVQAAGFNADISRIVKYAPDKLIGREPETALLNDAWGKVQSQEAKRPHILTFVALGGEGKTSLVAKWAADLAHQDWPGCEAAFAWSFYSQGTRDQAAASSDLFLKEALSFFGDDDDKLFAASNAGAYEKGQRLARIVGGRRALLILDGLEPLQYGPTSPTPGELTDQGISALLKGLAANSHGLCIVTTRYALPDLRAFIGNTVHEEKLTRLSTDAGVVLLQSLGVKGSLRKTIPSADGRELWNEYEKLVEDVKGHALTLNLLGTYLRDAHAGDIRRRDLIKLEEADAEEQGGHAFHVMDAYVKSFESGGKTAEDQLKGRRALALLQLLGLFDRPATADLLAVLSQGEPIAGLTEPLVGISEAQRNLSLTRLEDAKLLTVNRAKGSGELIVLDAHPLLREYFAQRLRQQQPEAWRAAHRRLYEHLCASTPDKPDATLEDLQPLYQAVAHGCEAGRGVEAFENVYERRIERGRRRYATRELGAIATDLSAFGNFFKSAWTTLREGMEATAKGQLVGMAGSRLRAVGRMLEAFQALQASFNQRTGEPIDDAFRARHLSEILALLGEPESIPKGEIAVKLADVSKDCFERIAERGVLADALFQFRNRGIALKMFQEAERIQFQENRGKYLFSLWGFRYCICLLDEPVKYLWKNTLTCVSVETFFSAVLADVRERAKYICTEAAENALPGLGSLDRALGQLCLGIVELLENAIASNASNTKTVLDGAVRQLRATGKAEFLPPALLTRAWQRFLSGNSTGPDSAQSDLDEAWEIAERGSMRLHMADIHLHRARLFGFRIADRGLRNEAAEGGVQNEAAEPYPWESPQADLAAAEKLINDCGYHRRDEELADAKKAILGQELM